MQSVPAAGRGPAGSRAPVGGRYALEHRIGAGGMCEVWRARDTVLDRPVAVKLLHPHLAGDAGARARFQDEARRAAQVGHPRVVRVYDAGVDGGVDAGGVGGVEAAPPEAWIAMELVDGPPLAEVLLAGALPADRALQLGVEVAEGLAAAHAVGVVHRDVKPGNVLLGVDGARLADFGIARAAGEARVTATGELIGTAAYLAPEQALGEPAAPASDVYALGCVLFEALTGRPRFTGEGPLQVALARLGATTTAADLGPGVPVPAAEAVVAMLAEDPADRPADGRAAADLLRAALAALDGAARTPTAALPAAPAPVPGTATTAVLPRAAAPRASRDRRPIALVLAVAALLGGAAVLALGAGGEDPGVPAGDAAGAPPASAPVAAITSFDPEGGGGEHEDEVALLADGDPATAWTTERYSRPAFGNLKSGVGVLLDLGSPVAVAEVRLSGMAPGQTVELRAADAAPTALEATTLVAEVRGAGADAVLAPGEPVTARHLLVWLTGELPAAEGGHRGAIGEVEVVPAG